MQLVPFVVELDETIYKEAKAVLKELGYTMEEVLVLFLNYLNNFGQLPFDYTEGEHQWESYMNEIESRGDHNVCSSNLPRNTMEEL